FHRHGGAKSGTANVGIRGVTKDGWALLRSRSIKLVEGRSPQWATSEIMIGRAARGRYLGAEIGQSITIARRQWQVVGIFDAGGAAFDSEIWADADQIADAARRTGYSTMTVRLRSTGEVENLRRTGDADRRWH